MIKVPKERREKKKDVRVPVSLPCSFCTDAKECSEGTTFDLSAGGMCFFVKKSMEAGHTLTVQCNDIWDAPKTGTVMWCRRVQHNLYRVGVSFK